MATSNFYDWIQDPADNSARRIVELPGDMRAVDTFKNGVVTREIAVPNGGVAKSTFDLKGAANLVSPKQTASPTLPSTPVQPAVSAPQAPPAPAGLPQVPAALALPSVAVSPSRRASSDYVAQPARPTAPSGRIGGPDLPQMFNPLAFDPRSSTSLVSPSERGQTELQNLLKSKGANRFAIPHRTGTAYVEGKDSRELATNWIRTMKGFRASNDKQALSRMAGVAQELFSDF